jgi:hypothetical protein
MLGLAAAGGVGYYLYTAGGSPKVAKKEMECKSLNSTATQLHDTDEILTDDAAHASAAMKHEMPGRGKEMKKGGELQAAEVGSKIDSTVRLNSLHRSAFTTAADSPYLTAKRRPL